MHYPFSLIGRVWLILLATSFGTNALAQEPAFEVVSDELVMVPMRDGVNLATTVIRPDDPGSFPVIMSRLPYGRADMRPMAEGLVPFGFAFVLQDTRGRFDSEGDWHPFLYEKEDGHDAIEWAASQEWSNGKVMMIGGSYAAATQWLASQGGSEHLVGLIQFVSPGDIYDMWWDNGAINLGVMQTWAHMMTNKSYTAEEHDAMLQLPWTDVFAHLPVNKALSLLDSSPDFYQTWIEHPTRDAYWERMAWRHNPPDLPVLHITGWYDIFQRDTIRNFELMRDQKSASSRNKQRLVVGPWTHNGPSPEPGDVDYGPGYAYDIITYEVVPFLQHLVQGSDYDWSKPVHIFTMGENTWNSYDTWPLENVVNTAFYLASNEGANSVNGDGALLATTESMAKQDTYVYDPDDPVPSVGGDGCCWETVMPWGAKDQRAVEERTDVLVYSTAPLEQDVRVTGHIEVVLYTESSAPDTDFTAKLVNVRPDGTAINLTNGIVRTSFRESDTRPTPLEEDTVTKLTIDLGYTSNLFKQGHMIRLEVSSSNFPRYSRNTNSGDLPETDATFYAAHQTVHHSAQYPSHVVLPIVPESD